MAGRLMYSLWFCSTTYKPNQQTCISNFKSLDCIVAASGDRMDSAAGYPAICRDQANTMQGAQLVKGTTVHSAISPEVPSPAAELTIVTEPYETSSLLEAPSPVADLIIVLESSESDRRLD